jgi:NADH:ubiquinone oxidoreductase subunit 2 (subunit N)
MAAISAYYYFRLIRSMYFAEGEAALSYTPSSIEKSFLLINALLVILLGVLPGIL